MNILAIDTTTNVANVTTLNGGKYISKSVDDESTHSEKLLPLIDDCLKASKLQLKDIEMFCTSTGPGSFTGIRIGIATIKGFAKVSGAKIFGAQSLEILAYSKISNKSKYILSLMDARNRRVYYALYKFEENNTLTTVTTPSNDTIADAIMNINKYMEKIDSNLSVVSEDIDMYLEELKASLTSKATFSKGRISSEYLVKMAMSYIDNKKNNLNEYMFDYATLDAAYIRPSQAERMKNGEHY